MAPRQRGRGVDDGPVGQRRLLDPGERIPHVPEQPARHGQHVVAVVEDERVPRNLYQVTGALTLERRGRRAGAEQGDAHPACHFER
jgi:hypothetical protein